MERMPKVGYPRELAVLCDLLEENWPSMDLVADNLLLNLASNHGSALRATRVCPSMNVRFGRIPILASHRAAFNADRVLNRMYDYPAYLRTVSAKFDLFHICDHSYAQLVHDLPPGRSGVFCHDLDTFKCLLDPKTDPRPRWFKAMARRILLGLERAALVFHTTSTVRDQIRRHGVVDMARLVQAPYGISDAFYATSAGRADEAEDPLPGCADGAPFLLHVGSCIPRKRIDVLLDVFAAVRRVRPELRLLQVGGEWSTEQRAQISRCNLSTALFQVPRMTQASIAALYRRAALVLMPSESEGFGLPVVEALACGSLVVASDIPVFREVGGEVVVYCPLGDVAAWATTIEHVLNGAGLVPELNARLQWTRQFSWSEQAGRIAAAYQTIC